MRSTLFTFLLLLVVICLQISCENEIQSPNQQTPVSYVDSLYKQADSLLESSKIDPALHTNFRALRLIENRSDSAYAKILRQRIILFGRKRPLDSALDYSNKLFSFFKKSNDSAGMADAFYLKGFYFNKANQLDSALYNAYKTVQLYKQLKDSSNAYSCSRLLTFILQKLGNYEEAELTAIESLSYLSENQNKSQELSNIYNEIGLLTKNRGDFKEALYWYKKALNLTSNKQYQNTIKNNIALTQMELHNYQEAFEILSELREDTILDFTKELRYKSRILNNWAFAKSKLNHPDAERYLLEALEMRKIKNFAYRVNGSYLNLAKHYADRSNPKAAQMAKLAYQSAKSYENPDDQLNALSVLIETAEDPREYAILYRDLSDSIQTLRERSKSHYAKIKYDAEHNRQENENLRAKAIIQNLEVKEAKSRNIALALVVIMIIAGWYIYNRDQKRRHLIERENAAHQAELNISKRVHDEVANDVFNLLTRLQKDTSGAPYNSTISNMVDKLYRKARNIARDYSDIAVGAEFEQTIKELLANYNNQDCQLISRGIQNIPWVDLIENKQRILYRILQEILVNMKKHSQATMVMVNFQKTGKQLLVNYLDDGIGPTKEDLENGHGVKNMEQRLEGIEGTINFDLSQPSKTRITVKIPF